MGVPRIVSISFVLAVVTAACGAETAVTTAVEDGGSEPTVAATAQPETTMTETTLSETLGTSATAGMTAESGSDDSANGLIFQLLESGAVEAEVVAPEGGVSGTLLDVKLANTTDEELEFVLPCGLVFVPDDWVEPPGPGEDPLGPDDFVVPSDQRMISVTPIDVTLGPNGEVVITPYVMCIDSGSAAPGAGASYDVGSVAEDDLFALAACVCEEEYTEEIDPFLGDIGLQMAMWATAEGALPDVEEALAEAEGAFGGVLGEQLEFDPEVLEGLADFEGLDLEGIDLEGFGLEDFDLEAMLEQAMSFMDDYSASAQEWLERCEIELGE